MMTMISMQNKSVKPRSYITSVFEKLVAYFEKQSNVTDNELLPSKLLHNCETIKPELFLQQTMVNEYLYEKPMKI